MDKMRKPFEGVGNVIRFNWHFYILSIAVMIALILLHFFIPAFVVAALTVISLVISFYIYDLSSLYKLSWLDSSDLHQTKNIININAGLDETSRLIAAAYKDGNLAVFDFYDPAKHTEVSIKRARKAYPPYPGTQQVNTSHLPQQNNSADTIFVMLAAHEIRNEKERIIFFSELKRVLTDNGQIIVTEHLRDTANFIAYNIGFFHFYSKSSWLQTFRNAGLIVKKEIKITPFISSFILVKNGSVS